MLLIKTGENTFKNMMRIVKKKIDFYRVYDFPYKNCIPLFINYRGTPNSSKASPSIKAGSLDYNHNKTQPFLFFNNFYISNFSFLFI